MNIKPPINTNQLLERHFPKGIGLWGELPKKVSASKPYKIINRVRFPMKEYITSILPDSQWVDWYGDKVHISETEIYQFYDGEIPEETKSKNDTLALIVGLVAVLLGAYGGLLIARFLFG